MPKPLKTLLKIPVIASEVMGAKVVRGYARLCDLAEISRPDIYDAKTNPTGTQRDLSPKHAREAYQYVRNEKIGFFPEVFLSLRDKRAVDISHSNSDGLAELTVDLENLRSAKSIRISRVDGNHRLHYADGHAEGFPKVERLVSFCLATDLSKDKEIKLFRDINDNQRRMNTSHLDNIELRLSDRETIARRDPPLYIASKLRDDTDSPLAEYIYDGGRTDVTKFIPLRTLKTGIEYMLSRPSRLTQIGDVNVQTSIIKNYFKAISEWEPDAWRNPKRYLMLRGAGLWGVCFLGADVIDRVLARGRYRPKDMLDILFSGANWDWSNGGSFKGLSGRGGALKISDMIAAEFDDGTGSNLKTLIQRISEEIT